MSIFLCKGCSRANFLSLSLQYLSGITMTSSFCQCHNCIFSLVPSLLTPAFTLLSAQWKGHKRGGWGEGGGERETGNKAMAFNLWKYI